MISAIQPNFAIQSQKVAFSGRKQTPHLNASQTDSVSIRFGQKPERPFMHRLFAAILDNDIEGLQKALVENNLVHHLNLNASFSKNNYYPLSLAAIFGHSEGVKLLLKEGLSPNISDEKDMTPLHWAVGRAGNVETVQALLEAGANVDVKGQFGYTPLQMAVLGGRFKLAQVLLKAGADPLLKNNDNETAVDFMFHHMNMHPGVTMASDSSRPSDEEIGKLKTEIMTDIMAYTGP